MDPDDWRARVFAPHVILYAATQQQRTAHINALRGAASRLRAEGVTAMPAAAAVVAEVTATVLEGSPKLSAFAAMLAASNVVSSDPEFWRHAAAYHRRWLVPPAFDRIVVTLLADGMPLADAVRAAELLDD